MGFRLNDLPMEALTQILQMRHAGIDADVLRIKQGFRDYIVCAETFVLTGRKGGYKLTHWKLHCPTMQHAWAIINAYRDASDDQINTAMAVIVAQREGEKKSKMRFCSNCGKLMPDDGTNFKTCTSCRESFRKSRLRKLGLEVE